MTKPLPARRELVRVAAAGAALFSLRGWADDTGQVATSAPGQRPGVRSASAETAQRVSLVTAARALASHDWVLMMRHERTVPGVGDPPQFRLGDCATQRNLSDEGRERARRAGDLMREANMEFVRVRAGRWCRVEETARLAFGQADPWPALDSFFGRSDRASPQREEVLDWLTAYPQRGNIMLVTHQVNITALLEVYPEQGEVIAARRAGRALQATLRFVPAEARA